MNLKENFESFWQSNGVNAEGLKVSLLRRDGITLFSTIKSEDEKNSVGALISGLWQAAESLSTITNTQAHDEYRLSFDSSESGVYILPFNLDKNDYYMGVIYHKEEIPGRLKNKLRTVRDLLESEFSGMTGQDDVPRSGFLFDNITDKEMDDLFSMKRV